MKRKGRAWGRKSSLQSHNTITQNKNLTPDETAEFLNVSVRTLAKWRSIGSPCIPYSKIGRCIRYSLSDLETYLAEHTFHSVKGE